MADEALLERVQDLSDLELAALLCLTTQEHCIIDTEPDYIDDLVSELRLIASNVFGLSHATVDCSDNTTLDDFANSILIEHDSSTPSESPVKPRQDSYFLQTPAFRSISRSSPRLESFLQDSRKVPNIIIAKNLDEAPKQIQLQVLELIRTKRIYSRTAVQPAPKTFLIIAVIAGGEGPRLTNHLNDHIFLSHFHGPEDGFPNLADVESDNESISSIVKKRAITDQLGAATEPIITHSDLERLAEENKDVVVSVEITRYIRNIVAFLRLHRAVHSGMSPLATKHFDKLVKALAPLQGLTYVTPSLVALAAKKVYPHRIQVTEPKNERSIQWGSNINAVKSALEGIGPEQVIEDVLAMVEVPL